MAKKGKKAHEKEQEAAQALLPIYLTGLEEALLLTKKGITGPVELPFAVQAERLGNAIRAAGLRARVSPRTVMEWSRDELLRRVSDGDVPATFVAVVDAVRAEAVQGYANARGYHVNGLVLIQVADPGTRGTTRADERRGYVRWEILPGDMLDSVLAAGLGRTDLRDYTMCTLAGELGRVNRDLAVAESSNPDAIAAVHLSHAGGEPAKAREWMVRQVAFVTLRGLDRSLRTLLKLPKPRQALRKAMQSHLAGLSLSPSHPLRAAARGERVPGTADAPSRAAVAAGRAQPMDPIDGHPRLGFAMAWGDIELQETDQETTWLLTLRELIEEFARRHLPKEAVATVVERWWKAHGNVVPAKLSFEVAEGHPGTVRLRVHGAKVYRDAAAKWLGGPFLKRIMPDLTAHVLRTADEIAALSPFFPGSFRGSEAR